MNVSPGGLISAVDVLAKLVRGRTEPEAADLVEVGAAIDYPGVDERAVPAP